MLVLPLLFVVILWYLILCLKWKKNIFDHIEKLPGLKWYPIFGTTYVFRGVPKTDVLYTLLDIVGKYRPLFKSWSGGIPEVNIMKPEHLQIVMRSSTHITKGRFYDNLFPWLGEGLFISEGPKWFLQRKLLTPTFHFKILDSFMETFAQNSTRLVETLNEKADGRYFDIAPDIACTTLDVFCETSMGVSANAVTNSKVEFIKKVNGLTELVMWRFLRPYLRWDPMLSLLNQGRQYRQYVKDMHTFSASVIALRKQLRLEKNAKHSGVEEDSKQGKKKHMSFLDLVLEASDDKNMISDSDLQSLVNTFIFAGFETTSQSTLWSLFLMGNNPEVQERVYEEVLSVLKDKPTPTTSAELSQLKYLECVIKEGLRLYPVLPIITRSLTEDVQIDDYKIPAGTQAILHIAQVHRDPEHYDDPNKFVPDRFLPENSKTRHPFAFIPFSAGPRNCIGQRFAMFEEKTILASVIKKYKVTSMETPEENKLFAHVILKSQNGINVKLEKRQG